MNKLDVDLPKITKNRIDYKYEVSGEWNALFNTEKFFIEYNCDVEKVPASIAIIPLICNVLPIAWLTDATINIKECDKDFFDCIPNLKRGYAQMYPNLEFRGKIQAEKIIKNEMNAQKGALAFFSGGVDAFNTLLNHIEEKPTMITVWGADIKIKDEKSWSNVEKQVTDVAIEYNLEYIIAKSNLRECFREDKLCKLVKASKDSWWHGFQHGIGIISHGAPVAYLKNIKKIYFASTYTEKERGKITCASDITIDPYLKLSSINVIHDGYEFNRQDKIHNIVEYSRKNNKKVKLRVCWHESAGENCCNCEKCWRTMLGIFAENSDPKDFGFYYTSKQIKKIKQLKKVNYQSEYKFTREWYRAIQEAMRKNVKYKDLPKEIRWFYKVNIDKIDYHPIYEMLRKIKRKVKKVIQK